MKQAVFRADATVDIGGGHVARCLTMADELARLGWRCSFATVAETPTVSPALAASGHEILFVGGDAEDTIDAMRTYWPDGTDLLVVDHYGLGVAFESASRPWCRSILVIDDLADRKHDCDWLLDQTFGRTADAYNGLVPKDCVVLAGAAYALLRPQFAYWRNHARPADTGRVLVALGTTDPGNATGMVLAALARCRRIKAAEIVLGSAAPHLADVRTRAAEMPFPMTVHTDIGDMAALAASCDLAIGSGGVSAIERCTIGLPSIIMVVAENQKSVVANITAAGAALALDIGDDTFPEHLAEETDALLATPERRAEMARKAAASCDGRGVNRAAMAVAPEHARNNVAVRLRPATMCDGDMLYVWQAHPDTRRHFRNRAVPDRDEHMNWLDGSLSDPHRLLEITMADETPAGVLRLDRLGADADDTPRWEVSLYAAPNRQGHGIGTAMLRLARRLVREGRLIATVHPENRPSVVIFEATGYEMRDGLYVQQPAGS